MCWSRRSGERAIFECKAKFHDQEQRCRADIIGREGREGATEEGENAGVAGSGRQEESIGCKDC